ncbi:MAG: hypothetical protein WCP57_05675 [Bacteroidota bacterium]
MNSTLFKRIKWKNLSLVLFVFAFLVYISYKAIDYVWTSEAEMTDEICVDSPFYILNSALKSNNFDQLPFPFIKKYEKERILLQSFLHLNEHTKLVSAIYSTGEEEYAYMHYAYIGFHWNTDPASLFHVKEMQFTKRSFKNYTIYESIDSVSSFSYVYANGFLILSKNAFLLDNYIIKKEKNETLSKDHYFKKINTEFTDNYQAKLMIHTNDLNTFITNISSSSGASILNQISQGNTWYIFNMPSQSNNEQLELTGTMATDNPLYNHLIQQNAADLFAIMPQNISYYNYYHVDENCSNTDLFKQLTTAECMFFNLENRASNYHLYDGLIIHTTDINKAIGLLNQFKDSKRTDSIMFGNTKRELIHLSIPSQIVKNFGHAFYQLDAPYYFFINNDIIFLNSKEACALFIDSYMHKKNKKDWSLAAAQFTCYLEASQHILDNVFKNKELTSSIAAYKELHIEYSKMDKQIAVKVVLSKTTASKKKTSLYSIWNSEVSNTNITYLHSLNKRNAAGFYLFAQDDANILYALDESGVKLWEKLLDEKIMSPIFSIDYYKNNLEQFVFNTASKIYIIDKQGNFIEDFPLNLGAKASSAMSCFYKQNDFHQACYFVPCENGNIYGYEINGMPMPGWNPKKSGPVLAPVQIAFQNKKEWIFYATTDHTIAFFDYAGHSKMLINNDDATQNRFSIIQVDSSCYLFNASKNIAKYMISNNTKEVKTFGPGEGNYGYIAYLPTGSELPNHAYIKGNILSVLNSKGEKQLTYTSPEMMDLTLRHISLQEEDYILLRNQDASNFYLINSKGKLANDMVIQSNATIECINNEKKSYIFSSNGGQVNCATLSK